MARRSFIAPLLFALTIAGVARAEPLDPATARALFNEGRELLERGDYAQACPKFEASQRLSPGAGTSFNLAVCWQKLGRSATAWARFLDAASFARQAQQPEREQEARRRAAELEPRLAHLTISVESVASDIEVTRDGIQLDRATWGSSIPVDPGPHEISAKAAGRLSFVQTLTVEEGASATVVIPELSADPRPAEPPCVSSLKQAPVPAADGPRGPSASRRDEPAPAPRASVRQSVGWALIGGGIGTAASGVVFVLASRASNESALEKCSPDGECESESERVQHELYVEDARRWRTLGIVSFGVAAVSVAAGALLVLLPGPDPHRPPLALGATANSVDIRGHF